MKNVTILGSTGSIGRQTLEVIRANPGKFRVVGLSAGNNRELLDRQIAEFQPEIAVSLPFSPSKVAIHPADVIVCAIVGEAGVQPTIDAINHAKPGTVIALANKEALVCAGGTIMPLARKRGVAIFPVDSEHYAVYECLRWRNADDIKRIILTASGGPFFGKTAQELEDMTAADALAHPTWNMGAKITMDSATLMNKGLEIIEAHHLFGVPFAKIDVVVHRESIVHSMVEFVDGSVMAQLANPDMRLPIQAALTHPKKASSQVETLDLVKIGKLTFFEPDYETFPALKLAVEAGKMGDNAARAMNNANECAVELFLKGEIKFTEITEFIKEKMYAI